MDSRSPVLIGTLVGCVAGVVAFLALGQDNYTVLTAVPVGTAAQTSVIAPVAVPQYTPAEEPVPSSIAPEQSTEEIVDYETPVAQAKSWTAVLAGALAVPLAAAGLMLFKGHGKKEEREALVSIDDLMTVGKQALAATAVVGAATMADGASAYPIFAQQGFANPREATGRIVCANCHLASKGTEIEMPQAVLPDQVFEAVTKIPYSGAPSLSQSVVDPSAVVGSVTFQGTQPVSFQQEGGIPVSQAMVEFDAPTTPNTVFKATIKVPYDMSVKQPSGGGKPTGLNVGAVVVLPEGFTLAPKDRIPENLKADINGLTFSPYSKTQSNILVAGPVPGAKYSEMHIALLSPDPATNKNVHFGTQAVFVGGNRGRGQLNPDGSKTNNNTYESVKGGKIVDIELDEKRQVYTIAIEEKGTKLVTNETLPAGAKLLVKKGQVIQAGETITTNPNVGGFGQAETEIVLQDPGRVKALLFFSFTVLATQTMLVIKKKQYEQVQLAEMDF